MIHFIEGDIFQSGAQALVNPVNCTGAMGKGLALQFKKLFPSNYMNHRNLCANDRIHVGEVQCHQDRLYSRGIAVPVWIVNLPTKQNWKDNSQFRWITQGLESLKDFILEKSITSVAIPAIGCGEGGLDWLEVRQEITKILEPLNGVTILVYEPMVA